MRTPLYALTSLLLSVCPLALAQADTPSAEAEATPGPDMSLEAISPESGAIDVGLAGEYPANIARYLLARGASAGLISPDGSKVAFRYSVTGTRQLWIVDATGGVPKQLTFGNGITFYRWLPDGSGLIYGADNDGNEQESYYHITADGTSERLLLPAVAGGFRSFGDISSDAKSVAYASTERNGLDFDIYMANLDTGEAKRLYDGVFGFYAEDLSPDGDALIVTESVGEDSDNLYLLNITSGSLKTLSKPEPRANHGDGGFAWTEDGRGFYFASNIDREFSSLHYYDTVSDTIDMVQTSTRDIADVTLCGAANDTILYTENIDGFDTLRAYNTNDFSVIDTPSLPEGTYSISCSSSSDRVSISINGWNTPGDIYVWDIASQTTYQTFESHLAGLDPTRFVRPQSITMKARDGVQLQGLLYLPEATETPPPVLFEVHGGPTAQSRASFDAIVQYHVNRGLAVFEPNVRGSTGFGRNYTSLDDQEKRRDSVRDLIDMAAALDDMSLVDMDRAAVSGGSYGGYAVNAVLALYPGTFKAGISRYGVADWVTALEIASPALKASDRIEYGDIREQKWIDFYTDNSPIRLAENIDVPVLYSHGVMDPRIDIYETETMVKALRANGIEAPYIRIADEGHGWRKLSNRLFYYRAEAEFLETVLGE